MASRTIDTQDLSLQPKSDRLIDIQDLSVEVKVPVKTIRNKLGKGTWPLPPVRIGRSLRWLQSEVDRLKRGEVGDAEWRDS